MSQRVVTVAVNGEVSPSGRAGRSHSVSDHEFPDIWSDLARSRALGGGEATARDANGGQGQRQMRDAHARSLFRAAHHAHAVGDRSMLELPCGALNRSESAIDADHAHAALVRESGPHVVAAS